jgi:hypothetical protein
MSLSCAEPSYLHPIPDPPRSRTDFTILNPKPYIPQLAKNWNLLLERCEADLKCGIPLFDISDGADHSVDLRQSIWAYRGLIRDGDGSGPFAQPEEGK